MCEAIFFVRDKVNGDPYLDAKCYKRGDVICVQEDGWNWAQQELTNPDWRIVKLPNITVAQAQGFLSLEAETDPQHPSKMLQRRGFMLNIDDVTIPVAVKTWFLDDTRSQPTRTINYTPAQFLALKAKRPVRADPNVLG